MVEAPRSGAATAEEGAMRHFLAAAATIAAVAAAEAPSPDLPRRLEQRASAGDAEARYHLGMLYNNGIVVAKDPRRAFALFRESAAAGDPLGHYKLGCYYAGQFGSDVVAPDEGLALRHKLVAAEAGYRLAQLDVANFYAGGKYYALALPWYEAAARQGDAQALYNLSVFARDGLGTARSPARAWAFFRLAHLAARGEVSPGAQKSLDSMWQAMTAAQRAGAQRIAATWLTGPTPLTVQALNGLARAEAVAAER
jgi:TPR repeat protein